ncbi:hypothetical protein HYS54_03500 [Candidatus Micrarchaeota archaeon]|nr:hypothetical protein [Candidatus Micrarchaeota archaeon]
MKLIAFVVLLLLSGVALAAISVDDAVNTASGYKDQSESIDIKPNVQVLSGSTSYWVAEIYYLGDVYTMVVINSETGAVVSGEESQEQVETHYLANFFATKREVSDFLSNTLSLTQRVQGEFETKLSQFTSIWEPQLQNVTLSEKEGYKSSLENVVSRSSSLRSQIITLRGIISHITAHPDIETTRSAFASFFSGEESFIESLRSASTSSTDFITEVNGKTQSGEIDRTVANGVINAVTLSLSADITRLEDDVRQNRNVVNAFFETLSSNAQQFMIRFDKRLQNAAEEVIRKQVAERIINMTNNYSELVSKRDSIDPSFDNAFKEAENLLKEAREHYDAASYSLAGDSLDKAGEKLSFLRGKIGSWPPKCSADRSWDGSKCACTAGVEKGGKCVSREGAGVNWVLVGGLLVVLAFIIVVYKKRSGGGGKAEQQPAYAYFGNTPK